MPKFSFKMERQPKAGDSWDWEPVDSMEAYEVLAQKWEDMAKLEDLLGAGFEVDSDFYMYRRKP